MKDLPKKVVIAGRNFDICYKDLSDACTYGYMEEVPGNRAAIVLHKDLREDEAKRTLLHEMLHAYRWVTGVNQVVSSEAEEEMIVRNIEAMLYEQRKLVIALLQD